MVFRGLLTSRSTHLACLTILTAQSTGKGRFYFKTMILKHPIFKRFNLQLEAKTSPLSSCYDSFRQWPLHSLVVAVKLFIIKIVTRFLNPQLADHSSFLLRNFDKATTVMRAHLYAPLSSPPHPRSYLVVSWPLNLIWLWAELLAHSFETTPSLSVPLNCHLLHVQAPTHFLCSQNPSFFSYHLVHFLRPSCWTGASSSCFWPPQRRPTNSIG